jgi:long-chain acyl-CoA synthetase
MSYNDFYERSLAMGRGLLSLGLQRGDRVGIYSSNSRYWVMVAFGSWSVGLIVVPVYDSLGRDAAQYIVHHSESKVVCCSALKYSQTCEMLPQSPTVKTLILMKDDPPDNVPDGVTVLTCAQVLWAGASRDYPNKFSTPDDLAFIMYTSGSTGTPKGCELTCETIVAGASSLATVNASCSPTDTHFSFLPLAHIYAVAVELVMYAQGARVGFARGAVNQVVEDVAALQPTFFIAVPRLLTRIYEGMQAKIGQLPTWKRLLVHWAMGQKIKCYRQNKPHSLLLDAILFKDFRAAMGGRMRAIISGGAPVLQDIFEFLCATISPNIIQGYGLTEVACGLAVQELPATNAKTVGPCLPACEIKLRPVPGTDYDPRAAVEPTGELLCRGPVVFKGYYKRDDLTQEAFVDGWFATGDVCMITRDNQIQIIDRAKQLVKLSQGEYIAMTALNDGYAEADIADFVYVYADPRYDRPIAVVFPKKKKLDEWSQSGLDLQTNPVIHQEIQDSLDRIFHKRKFRGFERITEFLIDPIEPTVENGLITPSMKPQYSALRKKYEAELLKLYEAR